MDPHRLRRLAPAALFVLPLFLLGCGSEGSASDAASEPATASRTQAPRPATAAPSGTEAEAGELPEAMVYKTPTCGCCEDWIEHLRAEGFEVKVEDRDDLTPLKDMLGIPRPLRSCHTAMVGKYLVEGHVPASDIRRLLAEAPQVAGLATPGMPIGSPGMEVPGRPADRYDVLAFDAEGRTTVFESH